jgi:hypothetical protein
MRCVMAQIVVAAGALAMVLLLGVLILGLSRSDTIKRKVGGLFRRTPRSRAARAEHYYKPYWSR